MEFAKSETRNLGESLSQIIKDARIDKMCRDAFRSRFAPACIKNESQLIPGEVVGGNENAVDCRETRSNSSTHVANDDNGDSDGDSEADCRQRPRTKARKKLHGSDYGVLPAEGVVRDKKILEVLPISRSAWWAGVKSGRYPAGKKLSARITVWPVEAIRSVIEHVGAF